jgi:hypothetical protein
MKARHAVLSLAPSTILALLVCAAVASAQTLPAPRLNAEQKKRAQALSTLVDEVFANKHSAPADVALTWQGAYLAADRGLVYVPYTINIDGKFTGVPVAMYVRVQTKDALPPSYDASKTTTLRTYIGQMSAALQIDTKDMRSGNVAATGVILEDIHFFEPPKDGRLSRGLWLPPGEYNIFVAMQEKPQKDLPRSAVLTQPITVPNLSDGLAISSVILAESLGPAPATSKKQMQLDDPFSIGGTRIVPAANSRLPRAGELTAVFFLYNPTAGSAGKPDLLAEYSFYQRVGAGVVAFKQSPPQTFNVETLPAAFDVAAKQQIMGGLSVLLAGFPVGDYQLEVKVTDKISRQTISRTLDFSVYGP